ncbi:hypothetical protein HY374_04220 [Candidatus Berkelbacteria bacterium]|nr:hypothetical protein [Candidatus Berkelbacteria bacterium]
MELAPGDPASIESESGAAETKLGAVLDQLRTAKVSGRYRERVKEGLVESFAFLANELANLDMSVHAKRRGGHERVTYLRGQLARYGEDYLARLRGASSSLPMSPARSPAHDAELEGSELYQRTIAELSRANQSRDPLVRAKVDALGEKLLHRTLYRSLPDDDAVLLSGQEYIDFRLLLAVHRWARELAPDVPAPAASPARPEPEVASLIPEPTEPPAPIMMHPDWQEPTPPAPEPPKMLDPELTTLYRLTSLSKVTVTVGGTDLSLVATGAYKMRDLIRDREASEGGAIFYKEKEGGRAFVLKFFSAHPRLQRALLEAHAGSATTRDRDLAQAATQLRDMLAHAPSDQAEQWYRERRAVIEQEYQRGTSLSTEQDIVMWGFPMSWWLGTHTERTGQPIPIVPVKAWGALTDVATRAKPQSETGAPDGRYSTLLRDGAQPWVLMEKLTIVPSGESAIEPGEYREVQYIMEDFISRPEERTAWLASEGTQAMLCPEFRSLDSSAFIKHLQDKKKEARAQVLAATGMELRDEEWMVDLATGDLKCFDVGISRPTAEASEAFYQFLGQLYNFSDRQLEQLKGHTA